MNNTVSLSPAPDCFTLPNGLRIVGERMDGIRSVSVGVWMGVGSLKEAASENGLSHFLEHMVFKGTPRRTSLQLAEEMDNLGGQVNAFTGKDSTCFYARVVDDDLPQALDMLSDLTLNAILDEEELEKERTVILEEIAMDEDEPESLLFDLIYRTVYSGTAGQTIIGPRESVSAYRREDLLAFRKKHYVPENCVVALSGNYDFEQVKNLCMQLFGGWAPSGYAEKCPKQPAAFDNRGIMVKDTEQTHISLVYPFVLTGGEDVTAGTILSTILGASNSSRLFQRLREELGLAYSLYTAEYRVPDAGLLNIYAGVSPQNAQTTVQEMKALVENVVKMGVTPEEVASAKRLLRTNTIFSMESTGSRMQSCARRALYDLEPAAYESKLREIEDCTLDEVMDAARRYLTVKPALCVIGKNAEEITL